MTTHIRKLLPPEANPFHIPRNIPSPSPFSSSKIDARQSQSQSQNPPTNSNNNVNVNPSLDSAMALTVLALLTVLLFMSFFSIYLRHLSGDPRSRRRRGISPESYFSTTASYYHRSPSPNGKAVGVGSVVIQSLPVHAYGGAPAKQGIETLECAICLSEFEEGEWVKEIPYCGHVFHVECIDTWLSSHVTCPLCRTARLFPAAEEEEEEEGYGGGEVQGDQVRVVVVDEDEDDTWRAEERVVGVRRSRSCSGFLDRVTLHRSLSF